MTDLSKHTLGGSATHNSVLHSGSVLSEELRRDDSKRKTSENVEGFQCHQQDLRRVKAADDVIGREGILIKLENKEKTRDGL